MFFKNSNSKTYLALDREQQQQTIDRLGSLLKERLVLQQSLAKQSAATTASNEQLFLELLELFDTLESLIDYFQNNNKLTERTLERLPKSLATIQSKLLATLSRRNVQKIELTDIAADSPLCQIIDAQINPQIATPTVTKVVRQGFKIGERLLRPVEIAIETAAQHND
jgi:molecular chaperone GrpE